MKRKEFIKKMDAAIREVGTMDYRYSCNAVYSHLSPAGGTAYAQIMRPDRNSYLPISYVKGKNDQETKDNRIALMSIFKENCLMYGTYKRF